jgi:hypothetical protein
VISDAQFAAWLNDSTAQRTARYRVTAISGGQLVTRYFTKKPLINNPAATPYQAIIASGLKLTQSISMSSGASLVASTIDVYNVSGERDSWLNDVWANGSIEIDIGDVRWADADFRLYYVGRISDLDPKAPRDRIRIQVRDMLQVLNAPITEEKMAGDVLYPTTLGEVPNISPKYDEATGRWYYGKGRSEGVIEARVDGKPRVIVDYPSESYFKFASAVGGGQVTCSVQGDKPNGVYSDTIGKLVRRLITGFGKASDRLTDTDIDLPNFAAFEAAHPQAAGVHFADRENVIVGCTLLASSVGAQLLPSRLGRLRLIKYAIPVTASVEIQRSAQVDRTIRAERLPVAGAVKIAGCRNYTVQTALPTSLSPADKELLATEWRSYTAKDQPTLDLYKLPADPAARETCLIDDADMKAEAVRWCDIVKVQRFAYAFQGTPVNLLLDVGQGVKLFSNRYNLDAGKVGLVTLLGADLDTFRVDVEVTA